MEARSLKISKKETKKLKYESACPLSLEFTAGVVVSLLRERI